MWFFWFFFSYILFVDGYINSINLNVVFFLRRFMGIVFVVDILGFFLLGVR